MIFLSSFINYLHHFPVTQKDANPPASKVYIEWDSKHQSTALEHRGKMILHLHWSIINYTGTRLHSTAIPSCSKTQLKYTPHTHTPTSRTSSKGIIVDCWLLLVGGRPLLHGFHTVAKPPPPPKRSNLYFNQPFSKWTFTQVKLQLSGLASM